MREVDADPWDVSDIAQLLARFDQRVPLSVDKREDFATCGSCSICGAQVVRSWAPVFRDSFRERAQITPGPLVPQRMRATVSAPLSLAPDA